MAIAAVLSAVMLLSAAPASAFDDSGVSPQGFNRFQYVDACYGQGDLWFQEDAYRYNADTITFQWWISGITYGSNRGTMHIKANTPGAADHQFPDYHLGGGQVFYAHISARLAYQWSFLWVPASGGSCISWTPAL
jgi:hypothetical protein